MDVMSLGHGVTLVVDTVPHVKSVTIGIWIKAGSRHESASQSGISHFLEHLLFKGSKHYSARSISQLIEGRGGVLNAFTQEESTCYYVKVQSSYFKQALSVLVDMVRFPLFKPYDIEMERKVIAEEIMMYQDQPQHVAEETVAGLLWQKHPLGRPITGTLESVGHLQRDDFLAYLRTQYSASNIVISVSGQVDAPDVVRHVEGLVSGLHGGRKIRYERVDCSTGQADKKIIYKPIEQAHLAWGYRVFGQHDQRRYALKLLSVILGENMSSRLFQSIREKRGLAYYIQSSFHPFDETGAFLISGGFDAKNISKAIRLISRELEFDMYKGVGARELSRAKDYTIGQMLLSLENTTSRMTWAGENMMTYGRIIEPEEIIESISAVTAEDIVRLAKYVFGDCHSSICIVAPEKCRDTLSRVDECLS